MTNPVTTSTKLLRLVIAEDHPDILRSYQTILQSMGHEIVGLAQNGEQLVSICAESKPDLVISDIAMPIMDGIEAADRICQQNPVAIVLISAYHDERLIERAQLEYVMAYLIKPITPVDLETAIAIATIRFEQIQLLRKEAHTPHRTLSDHRTIEKAMQIITHSTGITEADAFRRLQKMAWQQKRPIADIAHGMISTSLSDHDDPQAQELLGDPLTLMEERILQLLANGLSNQEIADLTRFDLKSVALHRTTAMQKLGLQTRADLVRYAELQSWLDS